MEHREVASLALAGALLPVGTVGAVVWATASYGLHWVVPLFLLLVSPIGVAFATYVLGVRTGALRTPSWLPVGGPPKFRDQIRERYHEEFSPESLDQPAVNVGGPSSRTLALALVYLVSVPVYTLLFWAVFG